MEQLSGLDAAFIHQDSRRTPMHICAVLIYDCGQDGAASLSLDRVKQLVASQLSSFPLFRRRLRHVAMGMDTPYWVDCDTPDWDGHITATALPKGSDWREFFERLSDIHTKGMDLTKPLWQIQLINGLCDLPQLPAHCQALILKIHHSAIDGMSMAAIIDALHSAPPGSQQHKPSSVNAPDRWELWARAHINSINRQFKLAETMGNLLPGLLRARKSRQQFPDLPPVHSTGSRFNNRVAAGRETGAILMPMHEVRAIKRTLRHVTLNDIALACVSGALRKYLLSHNMLPARSLTAGVPMNLRGTGDEQVGGNRIATMIVGLATDEEDPIQRLRLVHRYAVAGKKQANALGSSTVMNISDSVTPAILAEGIRTMAWASQVAEVPVPFHTMVSNVPGPPLPMYLDDARLMVPIGLGPIRDNMGLFHIVSSSAELLSLSFSACKKLLPDSAYYEECLATAFDELRMAAAGKQ